MESNFLGYKKQNSWCGFSFKSNVGSLTVDFCHRMANRVYNQPIHMTRWLAVDKLRLRMDNSMGVNHNYAHELLHTTPQAFTVLKIIIINLRVA